MSPALFDSILTYLFHNVCFKSLSKYYCSICLVYISSCSSCLLGVSFNVLWRTPVNRMTRLTFGQSMPMPNATVAMTNCKFELGEVKLPTIFSLTDCSVPLENISTSRHFGI